MAAELASDISELLFDKTYHLDNGDNSGSGMKNNLCSDDASATSYRIVFDMTLSRFASFDGVHVQS